MVAPPRMAAPRVALESHRHDDWFEHATCRTEDWHLFFEPDRENPKRRDRRVRAAKAVCAECPVRRECLSYALAIPERFGIWGGLTTRERTEVGRRLRPSRRTDRRRP